MTLLLIRHGQAAFAEDDYDRLSEAGRRQAARLGTWLSEHGQHFDAVLHGGMLRHRQTLEAIAAAAPGLPAADPDPDLAEFDHQAVFGALLTAEPDHPGARALQARDVGQQRAILDFLHRALHAWRRDELADCGERWSEFRARTQRAAERLASLVADDARVLAVSSAGVIARIAAHALELSDERGLELSLSVRNSALSEFRAMDGRLRLSSWNALPHLADARELWTYL